MTTAAASKKKNLHQGYRVEPEMMGTASRTPITNRARKMVQPARALKRSARAVSVFDGTRAANLRNSGPPSRLTPYIRESAESTARTDTMTAIAGSRSDADA